MLMVHKTKLPGATLLQFQWKPWKQVQRPFTVLASLVSMRLYLGSPRQILIVMVGLVSLNPERQPSVFERDLGEGVVQFRDVRPVVQGLQELVAHEFGAFDGGLRCSRYGVVIVSHSKLISSPHSEVSE